MKNNTLKILAIVFLASVAARAQVGSNPPYVLEQAVIASGGGQNSTGGAFSLSGTIGQPIAGARSTGSGFAVAGGFWTVPPFSATAASVSIGGRVLTPDGRGLRNARVALTDIRGNTRTALSGAFGHYRFPEIEVGQAYVFAVVSKRYSFEPRVVTVTEELTDLDFTAAPTTMKTGF